MLALAVLDVAGTTVDLGEAVPEAFRAAFHGRGLAVSSSDLRDIRGLSKRNAMETLLEKITGSAEPATVTEILGAFRNGLLEACRTQTVVPLAGVVEAIGSLKSHGLSVWLNTGFDRELASAVAERAGLTQLVDGVATDDDVSRGRPYPDLVRFAMSEAGVADPRRVLVVGDTVADLEAAAAAGVGCAVGVLTGAHDEDRLSRCTHDLLLTDLSRLVPELEALGLLRSPPNNSSTGEARRLERSSESGSIAGRIRLG